MNRRANRRINAKEFRSTVNSHNYSITTNRTRTYRRLTAEIVYEYAFLLQSKSIGIVISKVKCRFNRQKYICIISYFSYFSM